MALSADQELLQHDLRTEQMTTAIDQNRLNMKKLESELRYEGRRFLLQAVVAVAAALGLGAVLGNYFTRNATPKSRSSAAGHLPRPWSGITKGLTPPWLTPPWLTTQ